MKKIKTLALLFLFGFGLCASAQNACPKYKFWSNWNLGAELIYGQHYDFDIYKHSHGALVLGLMYRLGPTEKDLLRWNGRP